MRSRLPPIPPYVVPAFTVVTVAAVLVLALGLLHGVIAYLAVAAVLGLRDAVLLRRPVDWVSNVSWPFLLGVWIDRVSGGEDVR